MKPTVIVCPVEFSAEGRSALEMALALARCFQAELHVVRVESRFRVEAGGADAALRARVEDFVASANVDGRTVATVVLSGNPVDAVVEYSGSISGELIVVGQNGRRGSPYCSAGQFAARSAPDLRQSRFPKTMRRGLGLTRRSRTFSARSTFRRRRPLP